MTTLVLLRHGATRLAEENRFAGWSDTPLSDRGWSEARQAGRAMKRASLFFDIAYTSRLLRAQETLQAVLEEMALTDIPVERSLQLNERHYGQLQEQSRPAMIARHGNAQVVAWRRDYRAAPPLLEDADTRWQEQLERFADIDPTQLPRGESLADAADRGPGNAIPRSRPTAPLASGGGVGTPA